MALEFIDTHCLNNLPSSKLECPDSAFVAKYSGAFPAYAYGAIKIVSFSDTDFPQQLKDSSKEKKFKSIRDENPLFGDRFENAIEMIKRGGLIPEVHPQLSQLQDIYLFLERHPEKEIILSFDYIARKNQNIHDLSHLENVGIKLLIPKITFEDSREWILEIIDSFGTENIMFGQTTLSSLNILQKILSDFSSSDIKNLFSNSAAKWYKLES